ncbi:MAG: DEAD/DEAH box helicase [Planctomycetaceae bacterium]|jgi:ATP-dependent helicase YprA (DUF1998 family)|nr:DEAD/DEAH box helicase [Planctomycetaceae bacterium]
MFKEIKNNRKALLTYIESAYHLSDESLLLQRSELLNHEGVIAQQPYIESGAKYKAGKPFAELNIDPKIADGLTAFAKSQLLFNPPYLHQAESIEKILSEHKNIIVTTGTGSGKTECFLLPILGRLIEESIKTSFSQRAVRALLLYPMNALVNDQLGRLRLLFGSKACFDLFQKNAKRPVKFGRYTGRTLFAGLMPNKDDKNFSQKIKDKLAGLSFYENIANRSLNNEDEKERKKSEKLIEELYKRGKFPVKYSADRNPAKGFLNWFGQSGDRWLQNGKLIRTIERSEDSELLVRHEMQDNPPDILITNYSMLEYMLLRPIERNIFSITKKYYEENPSEKFILVLDESHLYNGAQGTEIAMLIRRLKQRLNLSLHQFQVILTSASFGEKESARKFAAELSGVPLNTMAVITSEDKKVAHVPSGTGTLQDAEWLIEQERENISEITEKLSDIPVFGRLANLTSLTKCDTDDLTLQNTEAAQEIETLSEKLFGTIDKKIAKAATDKLIELASTAKDNSGDPLFAARVHRFYRGLSGLWASCESKENSPICKIYTSSRRYSDDGYCVFELLSCRKCGSPYFLAYTNDIDNPQYLWSENVGKIDGAQNAIQPIQILLKEPKELGKCKELYLNLFNGLLSDEPSENTTRPIWIPELRMEGAKEGRLFTMCPICGAKAWNISNHKTKGDIPFQHLIASQLLEQPEQLNSNKPLKGRKVLIFSDGRQAASRLAGNLTTDSMRDALRPLILDGFQYLRERFNDEETLLLKYVYIAALAGAFHQNIKLAPLQKNNDEHFDKHNDTVQDRLSRGNIIWSKFRSNVEGFEQIPESVLTAIYNILFNETSGFHAIGLARIVPDDSELDSEKWSGLPVPKNITDNKKEQWKRDLLDLWIQLMFDQHAVYIKGTPTSWIDNNEKQYPERYDGQFVEVLKFVLNDNQFVNSNFSEARNSTAKWLKYLRENWGHINATANGFFLDGSKLMLKESDVIWARCRICTRVFPSNSLIESNCPFCRSKDSVAEITLQEMQIFKRVQPYRQQTDRMRNENWKPYPFIAKEHSAAIGTVLQGSDDAFALSEKYEIRFQDIEIPDDSERGVPIDVLSCTTTMEVGIDIGSLTAVAMRNVPPNRSNYQQRAGRAGRRGNALSTINTYADNDSHNQRYFSDSAAMISGVIRNPILNIDNDEIVLRHCFALIFSLFQQERITEEKNPNVFASLGNTVNFRNGTEDDFSYLGLEQYLRNEKDKVYSALEFILDGNVKFTDARIQAVPDELLKRLKKCHLDYTETQMEQDGDEAENESEVETENTPLDITKLLDRLFEESLLPSYAFPTDVVAMHVFDVEKSRHNRRPVLQYAPQYGLTQALTSYAPGKEVYIDGKRFYSFALWSPHKDKRSEMWENRKLYYECPCGYVELRNLNEGNEREVVQCKGCNDNTLGPARIWVIPPGFAQPQDIKEDLPEKDIIDDSFATRAKLTAEFADEIPAFTDDKHFTFWQGKREILLTNRGTNSEKYSGFNYCTSCGRIEPVGWQSEKSFAFKGHEKPFPVFGQERKDCSKPHTERIVLGTKFNSDVVLIRLKFGNEICLPPGTHLARIVLGTLAAAMSQTAIQDLEIEPNNIGGEFRPAATNRGQQGYEADVFLYDNISDGAGFVQEAVKEHLQFLEKVLQRLENCDCFHSCSKCLQTYQNRFIHGDLDRRIAASLLRYLLYGTEPQLETKIEDLLLKILNEDLKDKKIVTNLQDGFIETENTGIIVSHSLIPNKPASKRAKEISERLKSNGMKVQFVRHLQIDRALPLATNLFLPKQ